MSKKGGKQMVLSEIILKKILVKADKEFLATLPQRIFEFLSTEMNAFENKLTKFVQFSGLVLAHLQKFPKIVTQDDKHRYYEVLACWFINFTTVLVDWQLLRFGSVFSDAHQAKHEEFVIRNNEETVWKNDAKVAPTMKAFRFENYKQIGNYSAASEYGFSELTYLVAGKVSYF